MNLSLTQGTRSWALRTGVPTTAPRYNLDVHVKLPDGVAAGAATVSAVSGVRSLASAQLTVQL